MRGFYEEWKVLEQNDPTPHLADTSAKMEKVLIPIWQTQMPNSHGIPIQSFLRVSFSHHILILSKVKDQDERLFYIQKTVIDMLSYKELSQSIARDDYHHQGSLPNNFIQTLPAAEQAFRAISTFKDEYLLDFINVEELNIREREDVDERVVENAIIHHVKNFILTFGKDIPLCI
jgi:predicted nuclease of restriction endonuclease-like (RecB) superfamily